MQAIKSLEKMKHAECVGVPTYESYDFQKEKICS